MNIQSNLFSQPVMNADLLDRKTQITIINSEKMYNLCQTVLYKQKMKETLQLSRPQSTKQLVLGQLLKRE